MTAGARDLPAERQVCNRRPGVHNRSGRSSRVALAAVALALLFATSVHAQLALSASVTSDYRYRGASLGRDQPAVSMDVTYDTPVTNRLDGYFAGQVTVGQFPNAGLQVFEHTESIGVAASAGRGVSWDLGISNTVLSYDYDHVVQNYDPEAYAGLRTRFISCYVRYSPHYFLDKVSALYAEVDSSVAVTRRWRLFAHVGALTPFAGGLAYYPTREQYDGRLGVSTLFKGVGLSAAWTFQRPGYVVFSRPTSHPDTLSVTASLFF